MPDPSPRRLLKALFVLSLLVAVAVGGWAYVRYHGFADSPIAIVGTERILTVEPGDGFRDILGKLRALGVAGIARGWVLANAGARESVLTRTMVEEADAVFLCNAVRGILPVGSLGDRRWALHPALDALRRRLHRAEPAFATGS